MSSSKSGHFSETAATRFSAWTPVIHKPANQQLFQERTTIILHWFDLWTDGQRQHLLQLLLRRCSKSQLKSISNYFIKAAPFTRLDFTTVLPRILSLYILSFLSPLDLCSAAQVCWYWKFLSEQDCLWAPKCIRQGWFLTYATSDNEYGAWKKHYVACACTLDVLFPREAADIYGTLNQTLPEAEEEDEKRTECLIRRTICEKVLERKKADLKSRSGWLTNSTGTYASSIRQKSSLLALNRDMLIFKEKCRSESVFIAKQRGLQLNSTSQTSFASSSMKTFTISGPLKSFVSSVKSNNPPHLLLLSSRIPAYEMVLCGALVNVVPLVYDFSGMTLEALFSLVERATQGRAVQSIGIIAEGNPEEIHLIEGLSITERSVLNPDVRAFWEKLSGWVVPASEAGQLNIFVPLASSVEGMELISKLSTLTGLSVRAPAGFCTGSYQNILGEWSGKVDFPPLLYLNEGPLTLWCRQAEWIERTLQVLRKQLEPQLQLLSYETRGRTLGLFLWDHVNLPVLKLKSEVIQAVIEGLVALQKETSDNPLEFLGKFLLKKCVAGTVEKSHNLNHKVPKSVFGEADRRGDVVMELLNSEKAYVCLLQAVHGVYYVPLRAALDSNRAIISSANLVMVFNPMLDILEANTVFLQDLTERLEEWSPLQCVGSVFVRFCGKLRAYTNFFNNYATAIKTIDKCKETLPVFRAFIKRHNRTLATRMLSLQELFLSPSTRIEEYVTLLHSLMLHTPAEHPDHTHISSALKTLRSYRNFIHKLKKSSNQEEKMLEVQKIIQGCPNLEEGGRYLITLQDVALLSCLNEDIAPSFRMYECFKELGLFLFNDVVVLTEKKDTHVPFSLAVNTSHTFLASVSLHCLSVSDMVDTKYVQNSFLLESPNRQWICATDREEDKIRFLCALSGAINAARHK
ncbi:epithelial cell-transforming sequence 2 oncogene-like isoform X2 [Silurus asotus]|uniref:Epithelial cell-transforming sequence 2 oncogene-like isoform X2 n=1 Tax=Silurus asotus TaxID=30991 RepID=A0AAD5A6X2_SILAS|nr:epithelial cell-transforming sequence 2 oncogene-like isoform X2 [Silurus asotus]